MPKKPPATPLTAKMLRDYRDRIVGLEQEKKTLSGDIKDIYQEAKNRGFDMKALRRVVKDSMMDQTQRAAQRETEEIADVYRASLGMLDGTPLGDSARRRYEEAASPPPPAPEKSAGADDDGEEDADAAPEEHEAANDPEATRAQGRADHAAGKSILQNPYEASDDRRADWDEGWCEAAGSDGMDVPDAWRRRSSGEQPSREE